METESLDQQDKTVDFPMLDPDYIDNPAPYWKRLREQAPLYWSDDFNFWVVTRYDDVEAFLKRPEDFSSTSGVVGGLQAEDGGTAGDSVGILPMLQNDPPEHTRLRALFAKSFTPSRIADLETHIRDIAEELIAQIRKKARAGEPVDLFKDFASPLPVTVIAELLGIPREYFEQLRFWNEALGIGSGEGYSEKQKAGAMTDMSDTLSAVIEEKRKNPQYDLVSSLVHLADEEGEKLRPSELLGFCKLLWIAGNETTTNLISNASIVLQEKPDLLARLCSDKSLIPQFVEEALRYDGPVLGLFRRATRDMGYKGVHIRKNDNVWLMFASANRDEQHFDRPDEFLLERRPNDHMALGKGIHFCMGAALARLEAKVAFEFLVDALPDFTLKPAEGLRIPTPVLRGWIKLPMICKNSELSAT